MLKNSYITDAPHAYQVNKLALSIFDQLTKWYYFNPMERKMLEGAALLHDSGLLFGEKQHHKKTLEYILNLDIPIPSTEKSIIANIARYHRKACPKNTHKYFKPLFPKQKEYVIKMSAILRVADGLDRGHANKIQEVILKKSDQKIGFELITSQKDIQEEISAFEKKKDLFEAVYDPTSLVIC